MKAPNKAHSVTRTVKFLSTKMKTKKLDNCETEEDWIEFTKRKCGRSPRTHEEGRTYKNCISPRKNLGQAK